MKGGGDAKGMEVIRKGRKVTLKGCKEREGWESKGEFKGRERMKGKWQVCRGRKTLVTKGKGMYREG